MIARVREFSFPVLKGLSRQRFPLGAALVVLLFLLIALACSATMSNCWYGDQSVVCCSNGRCVDAVSP